VSARQKRRTRALCARLGVHRWAKYVGRERVRDSYVIFNHLSLVGVELGEGQRKGLESLTIKAEVVNELVWIPGDELRRGRNRAARSRGPWRGKAKVGL
jgi:hypothetical protein